MIAAPHQKQFQLYSRPIQRALAGANAGYPSCVVDALNFLPMGHAVPLHPRVDEQSTTGAIACGATRIAYPSNPRDVR
jgi:hypothetical protein